MRRTKEELTAGIIKGMTFPMVAALFLAGCSVHQSILGEDLPEVPASYSIKRDGKAPPLGKWWERFEDTQLNSIMEEAFHQNPDIAQAYERLRQSQEVYNKVNASRGLSVGIDGSGGRSRQSGFFRGSTAEGIGSVTFNTYSLSAAAGYELDLWGKLKSDSEAAGYDIQATEQDFRALLVSLSARIADLYYLAAEQRAQIELSDQTITSFQDTLDRVEFRYREGLVPALDVYQSRQNLASAKAQKPVFESTLAVTLNALSVLTGKYPEREIGGQRRELPFLPQADAGLPSQLMTRRPDIAAALARLRASDQRISSAVADRFPAFNLAGSYGGSSDELHSILDSPNIFWNMLLQIAQPLIDSGRRKAEVARTESVFRQNLAFYHETVLNAFREVEDALAKIGASEQRISMLEKTLSASESSLALALDNYMQGLTDYLPVLTEQLRHFTAKSNLLAARRQLVSDNIQLARSLGGEWTEGVVNQYISSSEQLTVPTGEENK